MIKDKGVFSNNLIPLKEKDLVQHEKEILLFLNWFNRKKDQNGNRLSERILKENYGLEIESSVYNEIDGDWVGTIIKLSNLMRTIVNN